MRFDCTTSVLKTNALTTSQSIPFLYSSEKLYLYWLYDLKRAALLYTSHPRLWKSNVYERLFSKKNTLNTSTMMVNHGRVQSWIDFEKCSLAVSHILNFSTASYNLSGIRVKAWTQVFRIFDFKTKESGSNHTCWKDFLINSNSLPLHDS